MEHKNVAGIFVLVVFVYSVYRALDEDSSKKQYAWAALGAAV